MDKPELFSRDAHQSESLMVVEMSRLFYLSRALHVAAELAIADHLSDEPIALETLAQRTNTSASTLRRLIRFLSTFQIFKEPTPDKFSNTAMSAVLRTEHPQSVRALLRMYHELAYWSAAGPLEHTVRTAEPAFAHVYGVPRFQYMKENADSQRRFDEAMARGSRNDDPAIASAYDFGRFDRIVDVGGGRGGLVLEILRSAPNTIGTLFEQPQVLAQATQPEESWLSDRYEMVAGDFLEVVPDGADCYIIKDVLHDFNDEQCVKILSNCRSAMKSGSTILIANRDLPASAAAPHRNFWMDINIMTLYGGEERSASEWAELFQRSGLAVIQTIETSVDYVLTEGKPR